MLVAAGAPLDHLNNLGWTALIESIVLGDGGKRHVATLKALVDAGANVNLLASDGPGSVEQLSGMAHLTGIPVEVRPAEQPVDGTSWSGC